MTSARNFDHKTFLKNAPVKPGVYQMYDAEGSLLYVGKAKHLKKRLSSYFVGGDVPVKTQRLVSLIHRIEVTVTDTETEALLLESNLIKAHDPRYNVLLKDDKAYPYIHFSQHDYPRLSLHRGAKRDKGQYLGPYPSSLAVRETINLMQKIFHLRSCNNTFFKNRSRPCLQYQINRCSGPCVGKISQEEYEADVRHAVLFLRGKSEAVVNALTRRMEHASEQRDYETAAVYRDQVQRLRHVQEQQFVTHNEGNVDVLGVAQRGGKTCLQLLCFRGGRLLGQKNLFPKVPANTSVEEVLKGFIGQYYLTESSRQSCPDELILCHDVEERDWLQQAMTQVRGKKVKVLANVRSKRAQWVKLALSNAQVALESHLADKASVAQRLLALQKHLQHDAPITRIECFDISHSQGEATQASCVVYGENGLTNSDYRRFNINDITAGDDYAALYQAITRRYQNLKKKDAPLPDILLIDGGKGQLKQAATVLEDLQINSIMLLGISKGPGRKAEYDQLWRWQQGKAQSWKSNIGVLHLLQQIRDEAHRFAITGHRAKRDKARRSSVLEGIPGVGASRRRALLNYFGGLPSLKKAGVKEIAKVPGISEALAQAIHDHFHD